jgi:hypothetical protein
MAGNQPKKGILASATNTTADQSKTAQVNQASIASFNIRRPQRFENTAA